MAVILVEEITSEKSMTEIIAQAKKASKPKVEGDDDDLDDEEVAPKKSSKKSKTDEEDDDDDVDDDNWDKEEDEEEWDPDFEEFDLPKSKKGKGGKGGDEDDFKIEEDDEFKDMDLFNDSGFDDEEEDF